MSLAANKLIPHVPKASQVKKKASLIRAQRGDHIFCTQTQEAWLVSKKHFLMSQTAGGGSVEMEAFLHRSSQQTLSHYLLGRILGQLQVMHTCIHRWVTGICSINLRKRAFFTAVVHSTQYGN